MMDKSMNDALAYCGETLIFGATAGKELEGDRYRWGEAMVSNGSENKPLK
jgi:hypothetical protein